MLNCLSLEVASSIHVDSVIPGRTIRRMTSRNRFDLPNTSRLVLVVVFFAIIATFGSGAKAADETISLAGRWHFLCGEPKLAEHPGALPKLDFSDHIPLPGTTDTNQKSPASRERATESLTQPWHFEGVCWYQRAINIPDDWRGQRVSLFLERTKYTRVWLDGRPVGEQAVFLTPQEYDLGRELTPGRHTLTIAVDNSRLPPFGVDAHQFSGNTQGNWNGIIGKIELRETDPVWIGNAEIYPDAAGRRITVKVQISNVTQRAGEGSLTLRATGKGVRPDATLITNVTGAKAGCRSQPAPPLDLAMPRFLRRMFPRCATS